MSRSLPRLNGVILRPGMVVVWRSHRKFRMGIIDTIEYNKWFSSNWSITWKPPEDAYIMSLGLLIDQQAVICSDITMARILYGDISNEIVSKC